MILWVTLVLAIAWLAYITYLRHQPDVCVYEFSHTGARTPTQRKQHEARRQRREDRGVCLPRELPPYNSGMAVISWSRQSYPVEFERRAFSHVWDPEAWCAYEHERFYTVPLSVKKLLEREWHNRHKISYLKERVAYDAKRTVASNPEYHNDIG